jgi:hypothetical protein
MERRRQDAKARVDAEIIDRRERSLDDALKGSFPASDPPAAISPHSSDR